MNRYIDIGVNLTNKNLISSIDAVLERASAAGVARLVVTGSSIEDSEQAVQLCRDYPAMLVCTAGVHPHHADAWKPDSALELIQLAGQSQVRAIGETGLDFNRNFSSAQHQIETFHRQLEIASQVNLPVFSHQRDAHDTFLGILKEHRAKMSNVVVHCFTDNKAALKDYLDLDCHIGITGWICDERRGLELQQLVRFIPENRLMVETDAPYLLPRDLVPKPKSRSNEPMYLPHILRTIARHQNKSIDVLAAECYQTSCLFFGLKR